MTTEIRARTEARLARSLRGSAREVEIYKLELELQQDAMVEVNTKLESSYEHFAELFQDAPVAYFILDATGRVVEANRAARQLADGLSDELVGLPLVRLVDLSDLDRLHAFLFTPDATSVTVALRANARPRRTVAVDKRTGPDDRLLVTMTEIDLSSDDDDSERARRLQLLGSSVCAISHELNNLMQKLGSLFGRIETRTEDDAIQSLVQRGHTTVRYGADLLRRMLRFGQHHPPRTLPVVVDTLLLGMLELLQPIVGAQVEVTFDPGAAGIQVMCDPGELELAMFNLTANARDAMPRGGQLRFVTRVVTTAQARRWLSITVQDTGCGMSPELQSRIFEPFVTTKPLGKGSGLGLATTKGIVDAAGGTISVASEPGAGTTFRLLLPVYVAPPLRPVTRTDEIAAVAKPARSILLVEDSAITRRAIQEHLLSLGYDVHVAARPSRALELASEHAFDVCIVDLQLPEMNGDQLARELVRLQPDVRIVFASGDERASSHGEPFLQKPFTLHDVRRALEGT